MKKCIKCILPFCICMLFFGVSVFVVHSFLSKTITEVQNVFTPGDIQIELKETQWRVENGHNLLPRAIVPKNPQITNTGKNDAWVFLRVSIPIRRIRIVDSETKKKKEAEDTELFAFSANDEWQLLERNASEQQMEYLYGYHRQLSPGETTSPLFLDVTMVNYLEGELDTDEDLTIPIAAEAIQSNLEEEDTLSQIYQLYLKQMEADRKEEET